ncbi:MAG: LpqB family beta-propeller domain-containing protein [Actinomycetota bacterium]
MRRGTLAAVSAGLVAVVTGCAGVPTSGPVVPGDAIDAEQRQPYVGGEALPPQPGASPEETVAGFLEAMKYYEPDYSTARQFLTPTASGQWDPAEAATIYSTEPVPMEQERGEVRVNLSVMATLDEGRQFGNRPSGTVEEYVFDLERTGSEWRISNPPPGLIIRDVDFDSEFEVYNLYYYAPGSDALVPDPVYVPRQASVATLLAQELLDGPSPWLSLTVETAFPAGTEVAPAAVVEKSGLAEVKLSDTAQEAAEVDRRRMVKQLAWTLGQIPGVNEVAVSASPVAFGSAAAPAADEDPAESRPPNLFGLEAGGVVQFEAGGDTVPVRGPLAEPAGAVELAVNHSMTEAVVVDQARTALKLSRLQEDAEIEIIAAGAQLMSPSIDLLGRVWAVDQRPEGSALIVSETGSVDAVTVPVAGVEEGSRIDGIEVSADGTRIAMVVDGQVATGVVVQDERIDDLRVVGVEPIVINRLEDAVVDVSWHRYDELAVLTRPDEESDVSARAYIVELDTHNASLAGSSIIGAESIAATWGDSQELVVGAEERMLRLQRPSLDWVEIAGVYGPAYPG